METLEKLLLHSSSVRANEPVPDEPTDDPETDKPTEDNTDTSTISGYALKFNEPSKDLGGFTEIIDPKALENTDLSKVVLLFNHDYNKLLASVENGNLTLTVDDTGLAFEAELDTSVSYIADVYNQVQNGNLAHCSFSFDVAENGDSWTDNDDGTATRTVLNISNLYDVSVVSVPAYDDTTVTTSAQRSYINYLKGGKQEMVNKTIDPRQDEKPEARDFISFIRSRGEKRDGLTTDNGKILIPEEITKPVIEELSNTDLAKYAWNVTVGTSMGKLPMISDTVAVLATKEELAAIADTDTGFAGVNFEVKTRAGKVTLSNELLDDSVVNLQQIITAQLRKLVTNTNNTNIGAILNGLTATPVADMDAIITAVDGSLDPNYKKIAITNMSGLVQLNTMKYADGHYMLQDDITAPSGKSLFGMPLLVINDKFLPGTPLYVGSLADAVAVITRNNIQVSYDLFDNYGTSFAAILRSDYQLLNKDAMLNLTLPSAKASK